MDFQPNLEPSSPLGSQRYLKSSRFPKISWVKILGIALLSTPLLFYFFLLKKMVRVKVVGFPSKEALLSQKNIFFTWHRYEFCSISLLFLESCQSIYVLGHQTFLSIIHSIPGWLLGMSFFKYYLKKEESGYHQVLEFFQTHKNLLIYVDSGRPYEVMKQGSVRIAKEIRGNLIPISFKANFQLIVGKNFRLIFPLPGATIHAVFGQPVPFKETESLEQVRLACESGMKRLEASLK